MRAAAVTHAYTFPPFTTRNRITAPGRSGGRSGAVKTPPRSQRAPSDPRDTAQRRYVSPPDRRRPQRARHQHATRRPMVREVSEQLAGAGVGRHTIRLQRLQGQAFCIASMANAPHGTRQSITLRRARRERVPYARSNCRRRPRPPSSKKDLKARVVGLTIGCREGGPGSVRGLRAFPKPSFPPWDARRQRYRRYSIFPRRSAASLPVLGLPGVRPWELRKPRGLKEAKRASTRCPPGERAKP